MTPDDELLNPRRAAELAGFSQSTMRGWRQRDLGPPYVLGENGYVLYRRSDLVEWLESRTIRPGENGAHAQKILDTSPYRDRYRRTQRAPASPPNAA